MTDIVIVKPGNQKPLYGQLSSFQLTAIEPPLWSAILAGYLRQKGYSAAVIDAEAENISYEKTAEMALDLKPRLIALSVSGTNPSASTMNMAGAGKIISLIKGSGSSTRTIALGLHPSALPLRTLLDERPDFVCQGEGFHTLSQLLECLKSDGNPLDVIGLWLLRDNHAVHGRDAELFSDLDQLPLPAWDLLPMKKYRAHNWHCFDHIDQRQPYAILYTSLGCPFKCSFCCINALFGKNLIRYRGAGKVLEELDFLVDHYGVTNIKIIDEMFALSEPRVVGLCKQIAQRNYGLNIWAYARVNTVTKRMLDSMKEAGVNWIAYGFESGSERIINDIDKGYSLDQIDNVVQMTYESGIHIGANYIFGLPEDDMSTMNQTLEMMFRINAEWANIYCAMAYPGSKLYDIALQNKWPLPTTWEGYSQYAYDTLPLPTKHLSGPEVLRFRDQAFRQYYSRPEYLSMMSEKFGPKVVEHLKNMIATNIERKYYQ